MWPKTLAQLLELAPHVTRLAPVANRYLQSKTDRREASRRAMEQLADGLRGDLGQIGDGLRGDLGQMAAAQAGIYHQLSEQSEVLSRIAADVRATRLATDEMEAGIARIEARVARLWITLFAGVVLVGLIAAAILSVFAVLHVHQFIHSS